MAQSAQAVRRAVAVALLAYVAFTGRGVGGEPPRSEPSLTANKCILCSAFGASHVPRICNGCNSKFSNKCILCNAFSPGHVPRICNSCNSKFSNKCILCNAFSPTHTPRICNSCNSKY